MNTPARLVTGVPGLDEVLGGGLLPGSLTVVLGAAGIGKTQLGVQLAHAGLAAEGRRGVIFDMCSRGDPQNHADYAQRIAAWKLQPGDPRMGPPPAEFFQRLDELGDYLHVFDYHGRRVTRHDVDWDEWRDWQKELNEKLRGAIGFLYGALLRGVARVVIDGVEPTDRPQDSIQLHLFEYVYHQVLRKDPEWVARDLFREHYRSLATAAAARRYEPARSACVLLLTAHETLLDDLIARPLAEGDVLANANTVILLGKVRRGERIGRGLYVAKHRGSACSDAIVPYAIDAGGLRVG